MAIERPILIDGIVMSYHEIVMISHIANAITKIDIMS